MSSKVIAIIGSTGNQGSATVRALCEFSNYTNSEILKIHAITRNIQKARNTLKDLMKKYDDKIKLIEGDYTKKQSIMTALQNCSSVFVNFASLDGIKREIMYGQNIVDAAIENNIKYIIWSGINFDFENPLLLTKKTMEKYLIEKCEEYNINYTILRPCTFMENFVSHHPINLIENNCNYFWDNDLPICWISTQDIGNVAAILFLRQFNQKNDKEVFVYSDIKTMDECMGIISNALETKLFYSVINIDQQNEMIKNENVRLKNLILLFQKSNQNKYNVNYVIKNRKLYLDRIKETKNIYSDLMDFETFVNTNIHIFRPKNVNMKSKM